MTSKHQIIALAGAFILAASLTACGGNDKPAQEPAAESSLTPEATPTTAPEVTEATDNDKSETAPTGEEAQLVIIEMGDADAIEALAKQAQNFEISEGTPVQIHGIYSEGVSTPSVQEQKADDSYIGISLYVDGDWDAPADKSEIYVEGVFQKGQYFMELHADPEGITVTAAPEEENESEESVDTPVVVGGWTLAESDEITDELYDMFRNAVTIKLDEEGIDYHAISYLGSQVVNGTNYCFIADITNVPENRNYMGLVYLYEALDGSVYFVNEHEIEGLQYANEYDPVAGDFGSFYDYEAAAAINAE